MTMIEQLGLFCSPDEAALTNQNGEPAWHLQKFIALDVETTGLDPASNRVIELAMVPFNTDVSNAFSQLFSIDEPLPGEITKITGITDDMLKSKPKFQEKASTILEELTEVSFILAYNAKFDRPFIESELARCDMVLPDVPWVDPFIFICEFDRYKKGKKLTDAATRWGIELENAHRALDDAKAAGQLMLKMAPKIGLPNLKDLLKQQKIFQWRFEQQMAQYRKANAGAINR